MNKLNQKQFTEKFGGKNGAVVINVLDAEMFRNEHIPGSINIPLQSLDFMEQVQKAAGKTTPVVVYSGGTACPAWKSAARQLEEAGYTQVYAYADGLDGWKEAGQSLDSDIPEGTPKDEAERTGGEIFRQDEVGPRSAGSQR